MFKSIQWKILAMFVLLTISVMCFVAIFSEWGTREYYYRQFTEDMEQKTFTQSVVEELGRAAEGSFTEFSDLLEKYSIRIGVDSYRNAYILDAAGGDVLYSISAGEIKTDHEITDNIVSAMAGEMGNETSKNSDIMDYAVPVWVDGSVKYVIYVADTKVEMYDVMRNILSNIVLSLAIGLCIAVFLGFVLSKTIIAPMKRLQNSAAHMAKGNFGDKIKAESNDEIGSLTEAFNYMASELSSTMGKMTAEKNKLETLLLYLADGVVAFDREGRLIHINPAAEKILGVKERDIESFNSFFRWLGTDVNMGQFLYLSGEPTEKSIDLGEKHIKVYLAPIIIGGKVSGVVSVFHDFTKQQKLENARREFVANVSHELRTPLTVVKSYTETLLDYREHDETEKHFMEVIDSETDRMTRLIKDLLALSRLDNNEEMKKKHFDLNKLTDSIYERLSIEARKNGQNFKCTLTEEPLVVNGDKDRIEQVIINIVSNALKYTPEGKDVEIYTHTDGKKAYIRVKDSGIGIPEADLPRIFERFYRVDKARSRSKGGTGLGLAIAKEIVDAHGGEIAIESKERVGTQVTISLPIQ